MSELLTLQRDFGASLRDPGRAPGAARWLAGDAALVERRLSIYRANVAAAAGKALAAAYPIIAQVVGTEFFDGLVHAHLRETPSTSGDLTDYGRGFADFLARFEHARSLPYLPDLARLEWAVHRAYGAADGTPFDPAALSAVAPDHQDAIRFEWAAGTAVIETLFPLARLWALHQPDHAGGFDVDWTAAEPVLVAREGFQVSVTPLSPGDAAFMAASLAGAPLGRATAAALDADAGFDLGALLGRAIGSGLINGYTLTPDA